MFEAFGQVLKAKGNRLAELREIFHGNQKAETFSFGFTRFPWLKNTQEEAVNKVMNAKDVAIVHGPPGTGKTTTLVEAIYETLHRENQVMVCAPVSYTHLLTEKSKISSWNMYVVLLCSETYLTLSTKISYFSLQQYRPCLLYTSQ